VRAALIAATWGTSRVFPAVSAHGSDPANRFSVKAGAAPDMAGLKVGSYWPGNLAKGMPCHNSTILVLDQETRIHAVILAGQVNGYRTAAVDLLAAKDARAGRLRGRTPGRVRVPRAGARPHRRAGDGGCARRAAGQSVCGAMGGSRDPG
jgi:ornithine cyclodeaminase